MSVKTEADYLLTSPIATSAREVRKRMGSEHGLPALISSPKQSIETPISSTLFKLENTADAANDQELQVAKRKAICNDKNAINRAIQRRRAKPDWKALTLDEQKAEVDRLRVAVLASRRSTKISASYRFTGWIDEVKQYGHIGTHLSGGYPKKSGLPDAVTREKDQDDDEEVLVPGRVKTEIRMEEQRFTNTCKAYTEARGAYTGKANADEELRATSKELGIAVCTGRAYPLSCGGRWSLDPIIQKNDSTACSGRRYSQPVTSIDESSRLGEEFMTTPCTGRVYPLSLGAPWLPKIERAVPGWWCACDNDFNGLEIGGVKTPFAHPGGQKALGKRTRDESEEIGFGGKAAKKTKI